MSVRSQLQEMHMHAALRLSRHSRENGNPECFPYLDSRWSLPSTPIGGGSDNSSPRLKTRAFDLPRRRHPGGPACWKS
jgi:hypothetical protein